MIVPVSDSLMMVVLVFGFASANEGGVGVDAFSEPDEADDCCEAGRYVAGTTGG